MAGQSRNAASLNAFAARNGSTLAFAFFASLVLAGSALAREPAVAVYLLAFWHYYVYWLAFAFGAARFEVFKRDAVIAKAASVASLAAVFFATPLGPASLAVIGGGILLNLLAARALGFDRTYYGRELAGLPPRRIEAFPYSVVAHPMIAGNVAAFGGTLLNPDFARDWWPLAGIHVALNVGLLAMESAGTHRAGAVRLGGAFVAVLLLGATFAIPVRMAAGSALVFAAAAAFATVLYLAYTRGFDAATTRGERHDGIA